ncbi:MAG: helix-turn-helix transcriptional regulator [Candidatus Hydrogenedentes bacterium]|nr:helix-turn-helix transcriptional regulator [Candidatus Hydrogenedentota bacterium]
MTKRINANAATRASSKGAKRTAVTASVNSARETALEYPERKGNVALISPRSEPKVFRSVRESLGLTQGQMQYLSGISVRKISGIETGEHKPTTDDVRRFNELGRLTKELSQIIKPDAIAAWLETPSEYFSGASPAQVIKNGESDRVWRLIWRLQDGVPLDQ